MRVRLSRLRVHITKNISDIYLDVPQMRKTFTEPAPTATAILFGLVVAAAAISRDPERGPVQAGDILGAAQLVPVGCRSGAPRRASRRQHRTVVRRVSSTRRASAYR